jgi:hypothetical protein
MTDHSWVYTASASWLPKVESGEVVLNEYANRLVWADSGKFAAALVPSHDLSTELARAPIELDDVKKLLEFAPKLAKVGPALQALQVLSAVGAVASVANLVVSVAGFAAVLARLQRIEGKLDAMLLTLRGELRDLGGKLDDVAMATLLAGRDSLERSLAAHTELERLESARRARDRFQDCRMASLALWQRTSPWRNATIEVATALELQGRYVASAIGELQATFVLGDAGAFEHVARAAAADLRDPMRLAPLQALRARTDTVATGLTRDTVTALAGRVRDIPVLATQLRAAAATTATNAARLAAFAHDAELPALLGAPGYEILRAMRDAKGVDIYALGRPEEAA